MKKLYGIFSDLHLEHHFYKYKWKEGVIYLNAGDTHHNQDHRDWLKDEIEKAGSTLISCFGNHDFYHSSFPKPKENQVISGDVAACTLWTKMETHKDFFNYQRYLIDSSYISDLSYPTYTEAHESDVEFLLTADPEIVMTHHSPTLKSISPKYKDSNVVHKFFHSDLDWLVKEINPKVWIHGHTHERLDYMIDTTRIICHPRGYPNENPDKYEPMYVEI
jgi:predicted phosphodiesterase